MKVGVDQAAHAPNGNPSGFMFDTGLEVWCNMEGRYVTFEADLSAYGVGGTEYSISVCNIAVFGTVYSRKFQGTTSFRFTH